jgi:response regulator RpfG family c-di-GMP phosphodiesterase
MKKSLRLRSQLYLTIIPLVTVVVLLSGVLAALESRSAITGIANKHIAYKAEQLRDFLYSEWDMLSTLGLDSQEEYRLSSQASFLTYAYSLLRSETESVLAFDSNGTLILQAGLSSQPLDEPDTMTEENAQEISPGWFESELLGEERIGVAFVFEPLGWTVAVTELQSTFFVDVQKIQFTYLVILLVSIITVTLFLSIFVGHVIGPVERLSSTISTITTTGDLSRRVSSEFTDEIGNLATRFNVMISRLHGYQLQLEATLGAEKRARDTAVAQEVETLYLLGRISDYRDEKTGEHLKRIGTLSMFFSQLLGQDEQEQKIMLHSSALHDIGKIGIPDAILHKPGKLTADEFEEMKQHTVIGFDLLKHSKSAYLVAGASIALSHHENWDGSGYPHGLAGEEIPLNSRIVSILDVFDALISDRPYKKAWSHDAALDMLISQRGLKFDPRLVDLFIENFQLFNKVMHDGLNMPDAYFLPGAS